MNELISSVETDARRRRRILIAMCAALIAVVASVSGLNVAQQSLATDLGASQSQLLWIINGYTMTLAALLLPIGAIGDRFGRKPVLVAGLAVFFVANVAAALSTTVGMLLVARIVGGAGAAMIMPVTLSVITSSFPHDERARAVGIWSGFAGAGGILGLFVSSVIIDNVTWPWLFVMPLAVALFALAMTLSSVRNSREHHEGRFDTLGSILSAAGIGGLVLGIHEGPEHGWSAPLTLLGLVAGAAALVGFVVWERHAARPLFDMRAFSHPQLATGSTVLLVVFAVMFGLFLVLVQFLQAVVGYSAIRSAAGLLPMALVMMPLSAVAPTIAKRFGLRQTLIAGMTAFVAGLVLMAVLVSVDGGYWSILPGLLVMALGIGLLMSPSTTAITEALPEEHQGVASALNDTVREFGGAVGIALLGSILNAGYRSSVASATAGLDSSLAERIEDGIGSAYAAAGELGADAPAVLGAAREALVDGWRVSMWVGVAVTAATFVYVWWKAPRPDEIVDVLDAEDDRLDYVPA